MFKALIKFVSTELVRTARLRCLLYVFLSIYFIIALVIQYDFIIFLKEAGLDSTILEPCNTYFVDNFQNRKTQDSSTELASFAIEDVLLPFFILMAGIGVALIVAGAELVWWKRNDLKYKR